MQKHLEQVLTTAGLSPEEVKALVDLPDESPDFKPDTFVGTVHKAVETRVKNDPEFYKGLNKDNLPKEFMQGIEAAQYGRAATIVRTTMLKAAGLTEADFTELGEDGKKIEVFTPKFIERMNKGDVTSKELQQKLLTANQEIEALKGLEATIEEKHKTIYEGRWNQATIETATLNKLASVTGLTSPADMLAPSVLAAVRAKYHIEVVDGVPEPRQKDNPKLKVTYDNGAKELTFDMAVQGVIDAKNLVTKKQTTATTGTTAIDIEGQGGLKINANTQAKINDRIAQNKKTGAAS